MRYQQGLVLLALLPPLLLAGCGTTNSQSQATPSARTSTAVPAGVPNWPAPTTNIERTAEQVGLSMLPAEGTALHIHTHLTVTFNGKAVTVPGEIGIDVKNKRISEIHTHDTSGIIHVESAHVNTFYLFQPFNEWNVPLGKNNVGPYTDGKQGIHITIFVNRKVYTGDYRKIALKNKADVIVAITDNGKTPRISAPFVWPKGY